MRRPPPRSSASTGSAVEAVQAERARRASRLDLEVVPAFYAHPVYLEARRRLAAPVLVVISGFVADCLETLEEILIRGREIWLQNGGEPFELLPAPNTSAAWAKALVEIAGERLLGADRGS